MAADFTSALYLGLHHPWAEMLPWATLSTGKPAALEESPVVARVAQALAVGQGVQMGWMSPSTLHLFLDLIHWMGNRKVSVFLDSALYPASAWLFRKFLGRSAHYFPHLSAEGLADVLKRKLKGRPFVVTDGWCPQCGQAAPLDEYASLVSPYGGLIVVDDTQALGILGADPSWDHPYGHGGGGTPIWLGLKNNPHVVIISSLAKGFGVPVASISGPPVIIEEMRIASQTRWHNSPVSIAHAHAAFQSLQMNQNKGEQIRRTLIQNVGFLQEVLEEFNCNPPPHQFPVQFLIKHKGFDPEQVYQRLMQKGVKCLLLARHDEATSGGLAFMITANHRESDFEELRNALCECWFQSEGLAMQKPLR